MNTSAIGKAVTRIALGIVLLAHSAYLKFAVYGLGGTAGYFVIVAYRHAPAALVAPFEYTALVWGAILGWVIWREQPEPMVWLGAAVIMLSGLYITRRETAPARPGV